ncbi:MAG: pilus assembly PilX N-terminal domain-containing protein [Acidobacteriota bacterium]|nr:MAG: pilus assembly PilX N-terminal domain-containing protein [Acidobacteriota bacterium]
MSEMIEDGRNAAEQHGSGLVISIFVLALLSVMGIALLFVAQVDLKGGKYDLDSKRAFYLAEAGLQRGREQLRLNNIASGTLGLDDELAAAAGGDVTMDFDATTVRPVYDSNGKVTSFTGFNDDVPLIPLAQLGDGWYSSYLTNDPAEGAGTLTDGNMKLTITSIAAMRDGSSELLETIVLRPDEVVPPFPASITLLGPTPVFDGGEAAAKNLTGNDCGGFGIPGLSVPVVGTIGTDEEADAELGVKKPWTFTSGPYTGVDTVEDLQSTIDSRWQQCMYLTELAFKLRDVADVLGDSSTPTSLFGTPGDEKIVFIDGDVALGNGYVGAGFLFVTGTLRFHGTPQWYGPVVLIGKGEFIRSGGGNSILSGAAILADVAGPDRQIFTSDDCSGPDGVLGTSDDGYESVYWEVQGAGVHDVQYCVADIEAAFLRMPFFARDFRQR